MWVKICVAIALGLGTMVGWKRIVVTVGEKIGKTHLTYGQGAAAEIIAAATIGAADGFGLPVSTTHVLSSGVAGTMVANGSGMQWSTVRSIALAWVLTLPAAMIMAGLLYVDLPPDFLTGFERGTKFGAPAPVSECETGDVVELRLAAREITHRGLDARDPLSGGRAVALARARVEQALLSELAAVGVFGFGDAVGVKKEEIACAHLGAGEHSPSDCRRGRPAGRRPAAFRPRRRRA